MLKFADDIAMFTTNSQMEISFNALKQQIKILSDILISKNLPQKNVN